MDMRVALAGLLAGCLLVSGGCTSGRKPAPEPPPGGTGVRMKVTASKAEYRPGDTVVLRIELTNTEANECKVLRVPEGGVTVLSAVRDGSALMPGLSTGSYLDGMSSFLRRNLTPLKPNATVGFDLSGAQTGMTSGRAALETSTVDANDESASVYWPVDEPGKYQLSARYVPPPLDAGMCRASGEPVSVSFTVQGG
jgi:hypothetical protein